MIELTADADLDLFIDPFKKEFKKFIEKYNVKTNIEYGDLENVYLLWSREISAEANYYLTALLLKSNIDIMKGMRHEIESYMFARLPIKSIRIPYKIFYLGDRPFADCDELESIYIDGMTKEEFLNHFTKLESTSDIYDALGVHSNKTKILFKES